MIGLAPDCFLEYPTRAATRRHDRGAQASAGKEDRLPASGQTSSPAPSLDTFLSWALRLTAITAVLLIF